MKHLHINEIKLNKEYFAICCDEIAEVIFTEVKKDRIVCWYPRKAFTHESHMSDMGIKHNHKTYYTNNLNTVYETREEAEAIINDEGYKSELKEHRGWCKYIDAY